MSEFKWYVHITTPLPPYLTVERNRICLQLGGLLFFNDNIIWPLHFKLQTVKLHCTFIPTVRNCSLCIFHGLNAQREWTRVTKL